MNFYLNIQITVKSLQCFKLIVAWQKNIDNVQPIPKPYRWDENSSYLFQEALSSFKFQSKINLMNETDYENKIENLISDLNSVLCGAADIVLTKTRSKTKLSTPKKT